MTISLQERAGKSTKETGIWKHELPQQTAGKEVVVWKMLGAQREKQPTNQKKPQTNKTKTKKNQEREKREGRGAGERRRRRSRRRKRKRKRKRKREKYKGRGGNHLLHPTARQDLLRLNSSQGD